MKAYTYVKTRTYFFVDVDKPVIHKPTDAIVRIVKPLFVEQTSILSKGMFPACQRWYHSWSRRLGLLKKLEKEVSEFKKGDKVLISCVCACGKCYYCKKEFMPTVKTKGAGFSVT